MLLAICEMTTCTHNNLHECPVYEGLLAIYGDGYGRYNVRPQPLYINFPFTQFLYCFVAKINNVNYLVNRK